MSPDLYKHPLFQIKAELLSPDERVALSYKRAKLVLLSFPLTPKDVRDCTSLFWDFIRHPVLCVDIAMYTILTIHVGLVIGTLSRYVDTRPELRQLCESLLKFDICGLYQLTERGHGVDSFNVETTATWTPDGYILNGAREESAKWMPATTPLFGVAKVSLVNALLIKDGMNLGSRFFVVPICSEKEMNAGVTSTRLPPRAGTDPLDFSHTRFHNVHIPHTSIVSADPCKLSPPSNPREAWWDEVWRVQYGSMYVSAPFLAGLKASAYITASYSMHRTVTGPKGKTFPIMLFRTQQLPATDGTAAGLVYEEFFTECTELALHGVDDYRVRHALIVIIKATMVRHIQRVLPQAAERLGAQGTFENNYIALLENNIKGVVIAEGDIVPLCNKVFTEILQGLYEVPLPSASESLLAGHAHGLLSEFKQAMKDVGGARTSAFQSILLPQSSLVIESMGHAIAYSVARKANLPQPILDVFESFVIKFDSAWYAETGVASRAEQRIREDKAISSMMEDLPKYLEMLNIQNYVTAPIVSDERWKRYLAGLPTFTGNAVPGDLISCRVSPIISARL